MWDVPIGQLAGELAAPHAIAMPHHLEPDPMWSAYGTVRPCRARAQTKAADLNGSSNHTSWFRQTQ